MEKKRQKTHFDKVARDIDKKKVTSGESSEFEIEGEENIVSH